jgi:polyisoprenoid-binding protein YceI
MAIAPTVIVIATLLALAPAEPLVAQSGTGPADAAMGHYVLEPGHGSVTATVRQVGLLDYRLRFSHLTARFDLDPAAPQASVVAVDIDARTFQTPDGGAGRRFAAAFLDAERRPRITFRSTAIRTLDRIHSAIVGDLTFRGVTRPVTLAVTDLPIAEAVGAPGARLRIFATTRIKRSDFGSTSWRGVISDEVRLVIEADFVRREGAAGQAR